MEEKSAVDGKNRRSGLDLPLISIILPFFRAEQTIGHSLDSVLAQTFAEFEVLCINDQSPDASQAIVDDYCRRDPRVVSLKNPVNIGHGASRNRGVAEARGDYVFHLDPDDSLPPHALACIYASAVKFGSEMTRGAYLREQVSFGDRQRKATRRGLPAGSPPVVNTTLAQMPALLNTTEGHWSYLYRSEFAKRVFYPTDLKMGQDSIFIVTALTRATSISITSDVIYHYLANPDSAMNTFDFRKCMDELEWRRRAWHVLKEAGHADIGNRLVQVFWNRLFFRALAKNLGAAEQTEFLHSFRRILDETADASSPLQSPPFLQNLLALIRAGEDAKALQLMAEPPRKPNIFKGIINLYRYFRTRKSI